MTNLLQELFSTTSICLGKGHTFFWSRREIQSCLIAIFLFRYIQVTTSWLSTKQEVSEKEKAHPVQGPGHQTAFTGLAQQLSIQQWKDEKPADTELHRGTTGSLGEQSNVY